MSSPNKIQIVRAGSLNNFATPSTRFIWKLGQRCNYACSYCYIMNKDAYHYPTEEELYMAARKIIASKFDKITFAFTGGEPTIHPTILPLIKTLRDELDERLTSISIQTNGSASLAFYKKLYSIYPACSLSISIHFEHIKEKTFIEKMQTLNEMGFSVSLALMYDPKQRERCKSFFEAFLATCSTTSIRLSVNALRSTRDGKYQKNLEYTEEDHAWMDNAPKRLKRAVNTKMPTTKTSKEPLIFESSSPFVDIKTADSDLKRYTYNNQGMLDADILCMTGMNCIPAIGAIMIQADGKLQCGVCNNAPIPNNIYTDDVSLETLLVPQICTKTQCTCPTDAPSPKWTSPEYAPIYLGGNEEDLILPVHHFTKTNFT